jgi:hypothetical protein
MCPGVTAAGRAGSRNSAFGSPRRFAAAIDSTETSIEAKRACGLRADQRDGLVVQVARGWWSPRPAVLAHRAVVIERSSQASAGISGIAARTCSVSS